MMNMRNKIAKLEQNSKFDKYRPHEQIGENEEFEAFFKFLKQGRLKGEHAILRVLEEEMAKFCGTGREQLERETKVFEMEGTGGQGH